MNKFLGVLVVLVLVAGAGLYFAYSSLGGIIEAAIEQYGSEITETKVAVNAVDIDAGSGEASISGLTVGAPAGFEADHTFNLGGIAVAIDPASLMSETVMVKKIDILAPNIWYELGGGGSNIAAIQKSVENYMAQFETSAAPASDGEEVKLVIGDLYIRDAKVNIGTTMLPGKKVTVGLPQVHLSNIGADDGGASAGEVVKRIMDALKPEIVKAAGNLDPAALLSAFGDQAGDFAGMLQKGVVGDGGALAAELTEGLKGKLDGGIGAAKDAAKDALGDNAEDAGKLLDEGAKEAGDAIKGMFGN